MTVDLWSESGVADTGVSCTNGSGTGSSAQAWPGPMEGFSRGHELGVLLENILHFSLILRESGSYVPWHVSNCSKEIPFKSTFLIRSKMLM